MATTLGNMTVSQFATYAATHGRCELIHGEVRDLSPTGARHGEITNRLNYFVSRHVYENGLGKVFAAETGFRLGDEANPTVRAPDIAFVASDRAGQTDTPQFVPIPPDLAVEVLSPDDRASQVSEKVQWWLEHGAKRVWVVDPDNRTISVHVHDGRSQQLGRGDTLDGETVLEGFRVVVDDVFTS